MGGGITSLLNWVLYAPQSLKSALAAALKCDPDRKVLHYFGGKKMKKPNGEDGGCRVTITQSAAASARLNPESCFLVAGRATIKV